MMNRTQQVLLAKLVGAYCHRDGFTDTLIPSLRYYRMQQPSGKMPVIYNSSLCLVVQGVKRAMLDDEIYRYMESEYLVVSVDLPATGQVMQASSDRPYLCMQLDLDPRILSELIVQFGWKNLEANTTERGLFVGTTTMELADCAIRLVRLLENPADVPFLAPVILREIHYRLLSGEHGRRIARTALADSNMQRIAQVIGMLKRDFAKPLRVEDMAEVAHMSVSSFHAHFKQVTSMSPLQYQKQLRLLEARRIMLTEDKDASSTAFDVGYESPSQFSREYSRMFGAPPVSDIALLRSNAAVESNAVAANKMTA